MQHRHTAKNIIIAYELASNVRREPTGRRDNSEFIKINTAKMIIAVEIIVAA